MVWMIIIAILESILYYEVLLFSFNTYDLDYLPLVCSYV